MGEEVEGEQKSHMDQIRWTKTKLGAEVAPLEQRSFSVKSFVQRSNKDFIFTSGANNYFTLCYLARFTSAH